MVIHAEFSRLCSEFPFKAGITTFSLISHVMLVLLHGTLNPKINCFLQYCSLVLFAKVLHFTLKNFGCLWILFNILLSFSEIVSSWSWWHS